MSPQKLRNGAKTVMVVLDGYKILKEKNGGHASLLWALHDAGLVEEDQLLVLAVFKSQKPSTSPDTGSVCCLLRENKSCQLPTVDDHMKLLQEEINRNIQTFTNIFKVYHDECKASGVKFILKIAADYQPRSIVINEANYVGARWIVVDRCFADDNGFQLRKAHCTTLVSLVLVSEGEELMLQNCLSTHNHPDCACKFQKPNAEEDPHIYRTLRHIYFDDQPFNSSSHHVSTSTQGEYLTQTETESCANIEFVSATSRDIAKVNDALGFSLQLNSWEAISEITSDFKDIIGKDQNENFQMFRGHLPTHRSEALVKTYFSNFSSILDAEKMVALSMHHKNILKLIGYHQRANVISLAFPYKTSGTLERFIYGARGKPWRLTFYDKMNIAIGISQGLQYMHEECPQGPVAHGDLKMSNIYMRHDLQPQITGFGHSRWLQQEQSSPKYINRHQLDPHRLKIVKTDILSFGILMLRLFCKNTIPHDNKLLIQWAQPLLVKHAFHEMLEEEEEYPDIYGLLRVMNVAAQCIQSRHTSRPSMSKVVPYLKGETSFTAEASPMLSDGSSPNKDFRSITSVITC